MTLIRILIRKGGTLGIRCTANCFDENAISWYELASEQGFPPAQVNLAVMYYNGHGTPQNLATAYKWLRVAVDKVVHTMPSSPW